jgi:hypothetical protein
MLEILQATFNRGICAKKTALREKQLRLDKINLVGVVKIYTIYSRIYWSHRPKYSSEICDTFSSLWNERDSPM